MTKEDYYLNIALAVSKKSTCLKKHYGAIIVNNDEIISTGFNGNPRHEEHCTVCTKISGHKDMEEYCSCSSVHAEMNAIIAASRRDMLGATLYLACEYANTELENEAPEPCEICLRLIKNSGIDRIVTKQGIIYARMPNGILEKYTNNI